MKSFRGKISPDLSAPFVALDFETADSGRDSACAIALVRVERGCITEQRYSLIRPPRRHMQFSYVHGITWAQVAKQPTFQQAWPALREVLDGVSFLAAHNSSFDRAVLEACCRAAGLTPPTLPFVCTMRLARQMWSIRPTRLPDVCARLGLPLRHHHAGSDAEACARIILAARPQQCQTVR